MNVRLTGAAAIVQLDMAKMSARLNVHASRIVALTFSLVMCQPGRSATASGPVAQILAPDSGTKLRKDQTANVAVQVSSSTADGLSWSLVLQRAGDMKITTLTAGTEPVQGAQVASLAAATLTAGAQYTLRLVATDSGGTATAESTFTIPDPQYTLIPLQEGNLSRPGWGTYAVDEPGNQVIYAVDGPEPIPFDLLDRQSGQRKRLLIPLNSSEGMKFSGDGTRLFFTGTFRQSGYSVDGLGYRDLNSGADSLVAQYASPYFTVDRTGGRVALWEFMEDYTKQFFLYDEATQALRQLTTDPKAIVSGVCPAWFGTTPLITDDGATVILITSATLGIVPADPSVGCRIFSYDVAGGTFKQIAALPASLYNVDIPVLSGDGRWLSFPVSEAFPTGGSRGVPALMDLQTGTLSVPAVDVGNYTSFDSAVTRDGSALIISTEADLDPRVGNADHNLELFYYDRATGQFTQISETLGGIGSTPRGCASYIPRMSRDGGVLLFGFQRFSVEGCFLDGPQRNEADGFDFMLVRAVRKRPGNNGPVL
ncbi:MAG: hypothetical protein ACHQ9S_18690, partial [Candidatus Binatia bacterium]